MLYLVLLVLAQTWLLGTSFWFYYTDVPVSLDLVALVVAPSVAWFAWFFLFKLDD